MIRWSHVIPRASLFVLFIGLSMLAFHPLVRWGIVRTGQTITGARVEIDHVRTAVTDGVVTLDGFRVADPQRPLKNLFEADHVQLAIDKLSLKRRRLVVTKGEAIGFRLGTDRQTSGRLNIPSTAGYEAALAEQFDAAGKQWLEHAANKLSADVRHDLGSVTLAQQLLTRWPQEYEAIETQTAEMQNQIERMQKLIDESGDNPLRNLASYQQAITELEGTQGQAFELGSALDRMRQQLLMDKDSVAAACKRDVTLLSREPELEPLNTAQLSEYLMGPELSDRLARVLQWLQWGRHQIPRDISVPLAHRQRGKFVFFSGVAAKPAILIHTLTLKGENEFNGVHVNLEGVVRGLSSDPKLSSHPVRVAVKTTGGRDMEVEATLDMRGEVPHDVVTIRCPNLSQSARVLGQADKLAINVSRARAELSVRMEIVGNEINGELSIKQADVQLTPTLNPEFAGDRISELVASSLDGVNSLEAHARVSGTLDEPLWKLDTNLGPALAGGIEEAIASQINNRHELLIANTYQEVDAQLTRLEQAFEAKQVEMLSQLEVGRGQIERIKQIIAMRVDMHDAVIDEDSPLRETFLR